MVTVMMMVLQDMTMTPTKVGLMAQTGSVYLTVCVAIERYFLHVLETQLRNIKHQNIECSVGIQLMIS